MGEGLWLLSYASPAVSYLGNNLMKDSVFPVADLTVSKGESTSRPQPLQPHHLGSFLKYGINFPIS